MSNADSGSKSFNTLGKNWLPTYNISPFGGDKREGAGVENYFFNSLLRDLAHVGRRRGKIEFRNRLAGQPRHAIPIAIQMSPRDFKLLLRLQQ